MALGSFKNWKTLIVLVVNKGKNVWQTVSILSPVKQKIRMKWLLDIHVFYLKRTQYLRFVALGWANFLDKTGPVLQQVWILAFIFTCISSIYMFAEFTTLTTACKFARGILQPLERYCSWTVRLISYNHFFIQHDPYVHLALFILTHHSDINFTRVTHHLSCIIKFVEWDILNTFEFKRQ